MSVASYVTAILQEVYDYLNVCVVLMFSVTHWHMKWICLVLICPDIIILNWTQWSQHTDQDSYLLVVYMYCPLTISQLFYK